MIDFYKMLSDREHELERKRTTALARQQWAVVIELDAKLNEIKLWKKKIADDSMHSFLNQAAANPTPTQ